MSIFDVYRVCIKRDPIYRYINAFIFMNTKCSNGGEFLRTHETKHR